MHESGLELRRTRGLPAIEAALTEADALLRTTGESEARSRRILERLEERVTDLAEASQTIPDDKSPMEPDAASAESGWAR